MSTEEVKEAISELFGKMAGSTYPTNVSDSVIMAVNNLLTKHGYALGKAKAKYPTYSNQLDSLDKQARTYFQALVNISARKSYHSVVTLGVQKISEFIAFVEQLQNRPKPEMVSKELYKESLQENEAQKRVIKILSESRGHPDLINLINQAKSCNIDIDENWVLAVSAINLIEAAVNKKLENLNESLQGDFYKKLQRLVSVVKKVEKRDIQQMLPTAMYKEIRNKLDHASHKYKPTQKEADNIYKNVISFLEELFQSS